MLMNRRSHGAAYFLVAALAISACSAAPVGSGTQNSMPSEAVATSAATSLPDGLPAAEAPVRFGVQNNVPSAVYRGGDWPAPYSVEVAAEVFPNANASNEALVAGQVDVTNSGDAPLVALIASNPDDVVIIALFLGGAERESIMVAPDSGIESLDDLKGRRIGAQFGTGAYQHFLDLIAKRGMKETDFNLVNMAVADMPAALATDQVDAFIGFEPTNAISHVNGISEYLMDFSEVTKNPNFLVADRAFAEQHRGAIVRFLASWIDAAGLMQSDADAAAELAAAALKDSGQDLPIEALQLAVSKSNAAWDLDPSYIDELTRTAEGMLAAGRIAQVPNFESVVDPSYLEAALELVANGS